MQARSFAHRSCRLNSGVVAFAAAAAIFAAPSAMAQIVVDPPPTADAGGPYSVAGGGTVVLSGTFTGAPPVVLLWTVSSGSLSDPTIANPVFSAVGATSPVTATFTVTTGFGSATSSTTITINPVPPPVMTCGTSPISVLSGAQGILHLCSSDPLVPITFTVIQSGAHVLLDLVIVPTGPSTADVIFTAPTLPLGQIVPDAIPLTITATNAANVTSQPLFTTVTVIPLPDTIFVTSAQYRTNKNKLRLDVTATSSVISPNVILRLQPYLTTVGTTFDPAVFGPFTNTGGGVYTLTIVGAPEPAVPPATPIVARSNLGGVSAPAPVSVHQ